MKKHRILYLLILLSLSLSGQDLAGYVNPFIGTQRMGHTFPGACVPFGMVQLSPDTDTIPYWDTENNRYNGRVYEYCSGYQYDDPTIVGFSHTHFSGTGHSDLGDLLIMPSSGELRLNPGTEEHPETGYRRRYNKSSERAEPGYYSVVLQDPEIRCELTATERVGVHRYTFSQNDHPALILDMIHNIYHYEGKNVWTFIRVENDTLITGYRQTTGWGRTRPLYFAVVFDHPMVRYGYKRFDELPYRGFYRKFNESENFPEMSGRELRAWFEFDLSDESPLMVKVGLSPVSTAGAVKNLITEVPHRDFEKVRAEARRKWNEALGRIEVEMPTRDEMTVFYTALYHALIHPVVWEDVDGTYRGLDQNIYTSEGFTNYTVFSLWDTYRALHPLLNLVYPERNRDMVESMLAHHDQSVHHMLPVWSHYSNENWCMIGYHSVSVIADALVTGVWKGDTQRALNACIETAGVPYYDGLGFYIANGYVAEDVSSNSVSKTLEYAYDDFTISQIAGYVGATGVQEEFLRRSANYLNVFDPETGWMRPRLSDGTFRKEFDPLNTHGQGFIEGNAWNYGLYIPHAPDDIVKLYGGPDSLEAFLDQLFELQLSEEHIAGNEDITRDGIIGLYVHGNEPGHHIPYLYLLTHHPEKTPQRVGMICRTMYANEPDGLCGNDDCGQMSAWYIFSALGFYPVCPGSGEYWLGAPAARKAVIHLEGGKDFTITSSGINPTEAGRLEIYLNGVQMNGFRLPDSLVRRGGTLHFEIEPEDE
ncbi:MAG: GH92 family glycosyl hydrolase [Bacteroidales bacterium]